MHYMEDLKDLLCAELKDYAEKGKRSGELSKADVEVIDTVLNSVKNIYKIDKYKEETEGYSEDGHYMGEGRIYGTSYARGRGRNARRDRMGRYSSDDGMSYARDGRTTNRGGMRDNMGGSSYGMSYDGAKEHLMDKAEEMLEMTHDPKERRAIEKFMRELED